MSKIDAIPPDEIPPPILEAPDEVDTGRLDDASGRRVLFIVLAILLTTELIPFQIVLVSLGARSITASFPAAGNQGAWMATIFGLVGGVLTPLFGKISDLAGKKRVMAYSLIAALAGLLIDALTTSWSLFLVGRALQAFAYPAGVISFGLMRDIVPRKWVSTAIGATAGGTGIVAVLGPVIGGLLTDHYSWRSLFWFMLIYIVVTIPLFVLVVPESKLRVKQKLDFVGAAILAGGVALPLLYLSEGQGWGWGRPATLAWLLGGVVLLGLFPVWERTQSSPLVDFHLLRARRVWSVLLITMIGYIGTTGAVYALNFMSQTPGNGVRLGIEQGVASQVGQVLHKTVSVADLHALGIGFTFNDPLHYALGLSLMQFALKIAVAITVFAVLAGPVTGWLGSRIGFYRPLITALLVTIVGLLLLCFVHYSVLELLISASVWSIGNGSFVAIMPNLIVEGVPQERQGISGGLYGAASAFGQAIGTAAFTAAVVGHPFQFTLTTPGRPAVTSAVPQVYTDGAFKETYLIFLGCSVVVLLIVGFFMRFTREKATGGLRH
jgi:MFS family permease